MFTTPIIQEKANEKYWHVNQEHMMFYYIFMLQMRLRKMLGNRVTKY